ncbi:MAG TPA: sulfite exporter TauE/SafE family protein [Thermoanaerobaculia bacterium]|nr:sulfite exporter TauE/SafE family protein [Thermoanaerobaculia bacterium]
MHTIVIALAAFAAGAINSIAGGGTLLSFPALVWIGVNPVMANATNTFALWPGSFAAMVGFRRELANVRRWLLLLTIPALLGGATGGVLLLHTSMATFTRLVPFLILGATLLLATQELITRRLGVLAHAHENPSAAWITIVAIFQFLVGIYGGYFGAGIGILILAALGLIGLTDMHEMNGLKNLLAICINGVAAIYFAWSGAVIWKDGFIMAVAAIIGGYLGARVARHLGRTFVRRSVVVIGLAMGIALFFKR